MSTFAKDLFAVLKSRVTVIACGVLTSVITARYLGPEGNGILATLIVYPDLLMVIGALGMRQAAAYYVGQNKYSDLEIFSSIFTVWTFTSLICVGLCLVLIKTFTKTSLDNELIYLALLPIPFSLFSTYSSGFFLGKNLIKEFNTVNWVPNVVKLCFYIVLIVILPYKVYGAIIGIASGYIVLFFLIIKKVRKITPFRWNFDYVLIKNMLSLGIIYAVTLLITTLNYKIGIALLEVHSNPYQIGIYSKGVSIVEYLWEIPTLVSTIVFARSANSKDPESFSYQVAHLLRICLVLISMCSIGFYIISEWVMVILYGEEFRASAIVQRLLLPGILLMTIFKILYMDLAGKGKPMVAIVAMLPALIINAALNILWDSKYGANGAALSATLSYTVSAVIFIAMYSRTVKIPVREILRFSKTDFDILFQMVKKKLGSA